jgi:hypothetical protein
MEDLPRADAASQCCLKRHRTRRSTTNCSDVGRGNRNLLASSRTLSVGHSDLSPAVQEDNFPTSDRAAATLIPGLSLSLSFPSSLLPSISISRRTRNTGLDRTSRHQDQVRWRRGWEGGWRGDCLRRSSLRQNGSHTAHTQLQVYQ